MAKVKRYLSLRALASMKQCSTSTVRDAIKNGDIPIAVEIVDSDGAVSSIGFAKEDVSEWKPRAKGRPKKIEEKP